MLSYCQSAMNLQHIIWNVVTTCTDAWANTPTEIQCGTLLLCQFPIIFFCFSRLHVFHQLKRSEAKRKIKTFMCNENRSPKEKHQTSSFFSFVSLFVRWAYTTCFFRFLFGIAQSPSSTFFRTGILFLNVLHRYGSLQLDFALVNFAF